MLFKDLKVGDTIYVKNPKQWDKPIKKSIEKIELHGKHGIWLDFYTKYGAFLGYARANSSVGGSESIFTDFDAFKKYWIDYHKTNVEHLQDEKIKICEALENACHDLATANLMEDVD